MERLIPGKRVRSRMTPPLGLALVGCGVVGTRHVQAAAQLSSLQITGLLDLEMAKARHLGAQYAISTIYADTAQMLADPAVEAVLLAVPTCVRLPLTRQVLASRRHLLLEKPVAMQAGDVRRMQRWQTDLVVGCCSSRFRCLPAARIVQDTLRTRTLGRIRTIHWRILRNAPTQPQILPPAWRLQRRVNGGGILMNWGCYDLDYLLGIWDPPLQPRRVQAHTWHLGRQYRQHVVPASDAETHVVAHVECDQGILLSYERGEYMPGPAVSTMTITGEEGTLEVDMVSPPGSRIVLTRADSRAGTDREILYEQAAPAPDLQVGVLSDFVRAVRQGGTPATDLHHGWRVQALTDAIYAAAHSGQPQGVPPAPGP